MVCLGCVRGNEVDNFRRQVSSPVQVQALFAGQILSTLNLDQRPVQYLLALEAVALATPDGTDGLPFAANDVYGLAGRVAAVEADATLENTN